MRKKPTDEATVARIRALKTAGATVSAISRETGLSRPTVRYWLAKEVGHVPELGHLSDNEKAAAQELAVALRWPPGEAIEALLALVDPARPGNVPHDRTVRRALGGVALIGDNTKKRKDWPLGTVSANELLVVWEGPDSEPVWTSVLLVLVERHTGWLRVPGFLPRRHRGWQRPANRLADDIQRVATGKRRPAETSHLPPPEKKLPGRPRKVGLVRLFGNKPSRPVSPPAPTLLAEKAVFVAWRATTRKGAAEQAAPGTTADGKYRVDPELRGAPGVVHLPAELLARPGDFFLHVDELLARYNLGGSRPPGVPCPASRLAAMRGLSRLTAADEELLLGRNRDGREGGRIPLLGEGAGVEGKRKKEAAGTSPAATKLGKV